MASGIDTGSPDREGFARAGPVGWTWRDLFYAPLGPAILAFNLLTPAIIVGICLYRSERRPGELLAGGSAWADAAFALLAVLVGALTASAILTGMVARTARRLAWAAGRAASTGAEAFRQPDLTGRPDAIGDLARALEALTDGMAEDRDAAGRFAAELAHEIRNPLASIRSAVETLARVTDQTQRARLRAIIAQDVDRLDRLIADITQAARLDANLQRETPQALDVDRLVERICEAYALASAPGGPVVRFLGATGGACRVTGREGPLGQIVRNLIDNARSFSPAGGEVRVAVSREGGEVLVAVEDDGPGVPQENLERIFHRFYTARPRRDAVAGHSGLGLAICRQIAAAHGGRVWAENRCVDEHILGARFLIALPAA